MDDVQAPERDFGRSRSEAAGSIYLRPTDDGSQDVWIESLLSDPSLEVRRLRVPRSEAFYEPHTPAENLYFIHDGQVRLFGPGEGKALRLVEILGRSEWFGAPALARAASYRTRAVAHTACDVSEVSADALTTLLLSKHVGAARTFLVQLASKLQRAHDDAFQLAFADTASRVIHTLLQFSHSAAATRDAQEQVVVLKMTHQEIAQAVGAARETVSLALSDLSRMNLLKTGRSQLTFNIDALAKFSRQSPASQRESGPRLESAADSAGR